MRDAAKAVRGSKSSKSGTYFLLMPDSKSSKSSKGGCEHNPDDLRDQYVLSKQRYLITKYSLEWDDTLNTDCFEPPLPQPYQSKGKQSKSNYSEGKSSKGRHKNCAQDCHDDTGMSSKGSGSLSDGLSLGGSMPGGPMLGEEVPSGEIGEEAQVLPSLLPSIINPGPSKSPAPQPWSKRKPRAIRYPQPQSKHQPQSFAQFVAQHHQPQSVQVSCPQPWSKHERRAV
jgi:hypothetical protein